MDIPAPARVSRADAKQRTRDRLIEAARRRMGEVGYQQATLDAIAAEAGCTKGALYWHFPSKQALFLALVEQSIAANVVRLDALVAATGDPARLKDELGRWIDAIDEGEVLPALGVELEIEARRDAGFGALHRSVIVRHEAAMADFLGRYFDATGEPPPMPVPALAATIITIFKGFALCRRNREADAPRSAQVVRLLLGMAVDG